MNIPDWLKPGAYGFFLGAASVAVLGFTWGGWVTASIAKERAELLAHTEVVAAMVPVCVETARVDPERATKLETIRTTSSYLRRDAVMAAGWATLPGKDTPDRDLAQACLAALEL